MAKSKIYNIKFNWSTEVFTLKDFALVLEQLEKAEPGETIKIQIEEIEVSDSEKIKYIEAEHD